MPGNARLHAGQVAFKLSTSGTRHSGRVAGLGGALLPSANCADAHVEEASPALVNFLSQLPGAHRAAVEELPLALQEEIARLPAYLIDVGVEERAKINRREAKAMFDRHLFPISDRSFEVYPIPFQTVNKQALGATLAYLAVGYRRMRSAPLVMAGTRVAD